MMGNIAGRRKLVRFMENGIKTMKKEVQGRGWMRVMGRCRR